MWNRIIDILLPSIISVGTIVQSTETGTGAHKASTITLAHTLGSQV